MSTDTQVKWLLRRQPMQNRRQISTRFVSLSSWICSYGGTVSVKTHTIPPAWDIIFNADVKQGPFTLNQRGEPELNGYKAAAIYDVIVSVFDAILAVFNSLHNNVTESPGKYETPWKILIMVEVYCQWCILLSRSLHDKFDVMRTSSTCQLC